MLWGCENSPRQRRFPYPPRNCNDGRNHVEADVGNGNPGWADYGDCQRYVYFFLKL